MSTATSVVVTGGRFEELVKAFAGCDAVLDASVGPPAEIVPSAREIAMAAVDAGVPRLCYTSSAAAQAVSRGPFRRQVVPTRYGQEKAKAEAELLRFQDKLKVGIVRPGLIWGPRSPWSVRHFYELVTGAVACPAANAERVSAPNLVFAPNLASSMLCWLGDETPGGVTDCADPWWESWQEYFLGLANGLGLSGSHVRVALETKADMNVGRLMDVVFNSELLLQLASLIKNRLSPETLAHIKRHVNPVPKPKTYRALDHALSRSSEPVIVNQAAFKAADLDVFTKWAPPQTGQFLGLKGVRHSQDEAIGATVAWLTDCGHVEASGLEAAQHAN